MKHTLQAIPAGLYKSDLREMLYASFGDQQSTRLLAVRENYEVSSDGDIYCRTMPSIAYFDENETFRNGAIISQPTEVRGRAGSAYYLAFGSDIANTPLSEAMQDMAQDHPAGVAQLFVYLTEYGALIVSSPLLQNIQGTLLKSDRKEITPNLLNNHIRLLVNENQSTHRLVYALPRVKSLIADIISEEASNIKAFVNPKTAGYLPTTNPELCALEIEFCT